MILAPASSHSMLECAALWCRAARGTLVLGHRKPLAGASRTMPPFGSAKLRCGTERPACAAGDLVAGVVAPTRC